MLEVTTWLCIVAAVASVGAVAVTVELLRTACKFMADIDRPDGGFAQRPSDQDPSGDIVDGDTAASFDANIEHIIAVNNLRIARHTVATATSQARKILKAHGVPLDLSQRQQLLALECLDLLDELIETLANERRQPTQDPKPVIRSQDPNEQAED